MSRFATLLPAAVALMLHAAAAHGAVLMLDASQAPSAAAMLDTMGVDTHFGWLDTPYGTRFPEVLAALSRLGLHHVRDEDNSRTGELARAGIRTTMTVEPKSAPEAIRDEIKRLNGEGRDGETPLAVDAVEVSNEPDTYWPKLGYNYAGEGYPVGMREFVRDVRFALRSDPATAVLPLIGPALAGDAAPGRRPPASLVKLSRWVDWGNIHPYPYNGGVRGGSAPYGGLRDERGDGTYPSVTLRTAISDATAPDGPYPGVPLTATETGFPTDRNHTPETLQARYLPRLYAEYFRAGLRRTFVYQLLDTAPDPDHTDPERAFGLLRFDLTERPAFGTVRTLAAILGEPSQGSAVTRHAHIALRVGPTRGFPDTSRVHELLLRRDGGGLLLLLWHEVSGEDASVKPHRQLEIPPMSASVQPDQALHCRTHQLDGSAPSGFVPCSPKKPLSVAVPDAIIAVEISG